MLIVVVGANGRSVAALAVRLDRLDGVVAAGRAAPRYLSTDKVRQTT